MTTRPEVSVLIPVLNEEAHLREAAAAMLAQQCPPDAEFIFIDGGSEDRSRAILRDLESSDRRVRVLDNPARRTPHALNLGLRKARGEYVARMDAHTFYPPDYLASGVARLTRGDVDWVSGPQLPFGTDTGSRLVARALGSSLGSGGAGFRRSLDQEVEVDSGFTGVWRRSTLEQLGGWDEEWLNDQDLELAARVRQAGGRIVCIPEMAARYVPRSTLRSLARQYRTYGIYRVKTANRHPFSLRRSQLLPPALTLTVAGAVVAPRRSLRRLARVGTAAYVGALGAAAVRAGRGTAAPAAVRLLPVWMTMHLSYGAGFLAGCKRYGLPTAAIGNGLGGDKARAGSET